MASPDSTPSLTRCPSRADLLGILPLIWYWHLGLTDGHRRRLGSPGQLSRLRPVKELDNIDVGGAFPASAIQPSGIEMFNSSAIIRYNTEYFGDVRPAPCGVDRGEAGHQISDWHAMGVRLQVY